MANDSASGAQGAKITEISPAVYGVQKFRAETTAQISALRDSLAGDREDMATLRAEMTARFDALMARLEPAENPSLRFGCLGSLPPPSDLPVPKVRGTTPSSTDGLSLSMFVGNSVSSGSKAPQSGPLPTPASYCAPPPQPNRMEFRQLSLGPTASPLTATNPSSPPIFIVLEKYDVHLSVADAEEANFTSSKCERDEADVPNGTTTGVALGSAPQLSLGSPAHTGTSQLPATNPSCSPLLSAVLEHKEVPHSGPASALVDEHEKLSQPFSVAITDKLTLSSPNLHRDDVVVTSKILPTPASYYAPPPQPNHMECCQLSLGPTAPTDPSQLTAANPSSLPLISDVTEQPEFLFSVAVTDEVNLASPKPQCDAVLVSEGCSTDASLAIATKLGNNNNYITTRQSPPLIGEAYSTSLRSVATPFSVTRAPLGFHLSSVVSVTRSLRFASLDSVVFVETNAHEKETYWLSVVNLDWRYDKAGKLLVVSRPIHLKGVKIQSRVVCPWDFGIHQMKAEEVHGPILLIGATDVEGKDEVLLGLTGGVNIDCVASALATVCAATFGMCPTMVQQITLKADFGMVIPFYNWLFGDCELFHDTGTTQIIILELKGFPHTFELHLHSEINDFEQLLWNGDSFSVCKLYGTVELPEPVAAYLSESHIIFYHTPLSMCPYIAGSDHSDPDIAIGEHTASSETWKSVSWTFSSLFPPILVEGNSQRQRLLV